MTPEPTVTMPRALLRKLIESAHADAAYAENISHAQSVEDAIREAESILAQPQGQEPVAWLHVLWSADGTKEMDDVLFSPDHQFGDEGDHYSIGSSITSTPLYAALTPTAG